MNNKDIKVFVESLFKENKTEILVKALTLYTSYLNENNCNNEEYEYLNNFLHLFKNEKEQNNFFKKKMNINKDVNKEKELINDIFLYFV